MINTIALILSLLACLVALTSVRVAQMRIKVADRGGYLAGLLEAAGIAERNNDTRTAHDLMQLAKNHGLVSYETREIGRDDQR